MLAPQPIPVSLPAVCAGCFFAGAGELEEEEVWPFTSKVWAALAVATIRTASRSKPLNTGPLYTFPSPNADRTIPPPRTPADRHPEGGWGMHTCPAVVPQMQETPDAVGHLCIPGGQVPENTYQPLSGFPESKPATHESPPKYICAPRCGQLLATSNSGCRHHPAGARDSRAFARNGVAGDYIL